MARLVGILDSVHNAWRDYVRVWDGWGRDDDSQPPLADPVRTVPRTTGLLSRIRGVLSR